MRRCFSTAVVGVLGCADAADPSTDPTTTAADSSADASEGATTTVAPTGPSGIDGLLVDPAGLPLGNFQVLGCLADTCFFGESEANGTFSFDIDPPAEVALKTHSVITMTPRWGAALEPIHIVDDTRIDAGTLHIPELPDGALLAPESEDPQTLAVGDGLELTVRRADLTPAPGVFLNDLAARRIPDEHVPPYPDLGGETVVAVFVLHPFETSSDSPIAVRVPSELPAGTEVSVRTIFHLDGTFSDPVTGHADGAFITTDPGEGIALLTYLVISREE
jgi:hypothetical protein